MNNVGDKINALRRFKQAYAALCIEWDRNGINLNDTDAISLYPFDKSFDELNITAWIDSTVKELEAQSNHMAEPRLSEKDVRMLYSVVNECESIIHSLTSEEVQHLLLTLKSLSYTKAIEAFYEYLVKSLPSGPNSTPKEQEDLDRAWEKFYDTPFVIQFGDMSVKINNEATIYNGIVDTLRELIDYCL